MDADGIVSVTNYLNMKIAKKEGAKLYFSGLILTFYY